MSKFLRSSMVGALAAALTAPLFAADHGRLEMSFTFDTDNVLECEILDAPAFSFGGVDTLGSYIARSQITIECPPEVNFAILVEESPDSTDWDSGSFYKDHYVEIWAGGEADTAEISFNGRRADNAIGCERPTGVNQASRVSAAGYRFYALGGRTGSTSSNRNVCLRKEADSEDNIYTVDLISILQLRELPEQGDLDGLMTEFSLPLTVQFAQGEG